MKKKILFIADPLKTINPKKDSTLALMVAFFNQECDIYCITPEQIHLGFNECLLSPQKITFANHVNSVWLAQVHEETVKFTWGIDAIIDEHEVHDHKSQISITEFNIVLERTDPPFNMEYYYRQLLLKRIATQYPHIVFINNPEAILTHNEKLTILEFAEHTPKTFVSKQIYLLKEFWQQQTNQGFDVIFKPLDGMGGQGIFRAGKQEKNINAILEVLTKDGQETIMAQQFIPQVTDGDKRILIIDGIPIDYAVHRIAQSGETRSNLAKGGHAIVQPISESNKKVALKVGEILKKRGLYLIGLDMIGDYITEINVTSPTCFREIMAQKQYDVADLLVRKLLNENSVN